jgi:hypothetical protein
MRSSRTCFPQTAWQAPLAKLFVCILLLAAVLSVSLPAFGQSPSEEAELRELAPYLNDLDLAVPDVPRSSCSARLIGYALLYRQQPAKYRNAFFAELAIDDYAERADGKYNYIDPDEIASTIDAASVAPGGIDDRRVLAAAGFCALKTGNLWVATRGSGNVSIARILRGIALSLLLEGTDEDASAIANAIDAMTAGQSGS